MLTSEQRALAQGYLQLKEGWSQSNDRFLAGVPRAQVPALAPSDAVLLYAIKYGNPYTGDPLWGVVDFYTNPNRLMSALLAGPDAVKHLFIDCDDVACLYYAMVRQLPGYKLQLITLIDERVVGSHVATEFTAPDGKTGVLDTNGLTYLPDLTEETVDAHWTKMYASRQYNYIGVIPTRYPFQ